MKIVVLIRQTLTTKKIWHVEVTDEEWVHKVYESNKNYTWFIDCDTDAFILQQNQLENSVKFTKDSLQSTPNLELSKRTLAMWKHYNHPILEEELQNWMHTAFQSIQQANKEGSYPYEDILPTIAQDPNGKILMQAWVNQEALRTANKIGLGSYFSRSRNKLWIKGEESGHKQKILSWTLQQEFPYTVIYHVHQTIAACHTGQYSCFFRELNSWSQH